MLQGSAIGPRESDALHCRFADRNYATGSILNIELYLAKERI